METRVINATQEEIGLSIKDSDIATLYIIQHELLEKSEIDFAGVIVKHPLTNEYWLRVNSSKGDPIKQIIASTDSASKNVQEIKKLFHTKIKGN